MAEVFELDDHSRVVIETYDDEGMFDQIELVSRSDDGSLKFSEAADRALPAARMLIEKLGDVAPNVKEVQVEFGLKFVGEVGALIARTGTEANFKVTLTWAPNADSS